MIRTDSQEPESNIVSVTQDLLTKSISLNSMFMRPAYLEKSAWLEHIPFAFWLIEAHRPRVLVELGTHYGASYFAFCQAIDHLGIDTKCFAIDSWEGDEHAGFYDGKVFEQVKAYNEANYSAFSQLIKNSFDDAVPYFTDGTIDLLHIDGFHTFKRVKEDFENWLPKLSKRGVVLMHDTNVRENQFGVFKFFEMIKEEYPSFEFIHGHGLGVIGVGTEQDDMLKRLYDAQNNDSLSRNIHTVFGRLGRACADAFVRNEQHKYILRLENTIEQYGYEATTGKSISNSDDVFNSPESAMHLQQSQGATDPAASNSFDRRKMLQIGLSGARKSPVQPVIFQVYFPQAAYPDTEYSEEFAREVPLVTDQWQLIDIEIPSSQSMKDGQLRLDIADQLSLVKIQSIKLIDVSTGEAVWTAEKDRGFKDCTTAGDSLLVSSDQNLLILCTGMDPMLFLPVIPALPKAPLRLTVWMWVSRNLAEAFKIVAAVDEAKADLARQFESSQDHVAAQAERINDVDKQLNDAHVQIEKQKIWKNEIDILSRKMELIADNARTLEAERDEMKMSLDTACAELDELKKSLQISRNDVGAMGRKVELLVDNARSLEAERDALKASRDTMSQELDAAGRSLQASKSEVDALGLKIRTLADYARSLEAERDGMKASLDAERASMTASLEAERDDMKASLGAVHEELEEQKRGFQASRSEADALGRKVKRLADYARTLEMERDEKVSAIKISHEEVRNYSDEVVALTKLLYSAEEEREKLKSEMNLAQAALGKRLGNIVIHLLQSHPSQLTQEVVETFAVWMKDVGMIDSEWYLKKYSDVADAGLDPVEHYIRYGAEEGREPFSVVHEIL